MRRAKIVCTLGPATSSAENIRELVRSGMDVARLNLSHGEYAVHEEVYANVRKAAEDSGRAVAVMVDLQGPKIRLGKFANGPHELAVGDIFKITTDDIPGTKEIVSTTFKGLPGDVKPGDFLLIDDGKVRVEVVSVDGPVVTTKVIVGGPVSNNKGINLPGVAVNVPALSEKDEADLLLGDTLVIVIHYGMFQQLVLLDHAGKLVEGDEDVVDAVMFVVTRRAGGGGGHDHRAHAGVVGADWPGIGRHAHLHHPGV